LAETLQELLRAWQKPIYFVLGNRDFHRSSIRGTRAAAAQLAESEPLLNYLTNASVMELSPQTALIGHDGWADARLGNFHRSPIIHDDYFQIEELNQWRPDGGLNKSSLRNVLQRLGDEAAQHFERVLLQAVARYPTVIAATHVPPFREAVWRDGERLDDNHLPHFTCQAVGQVMRRVMESHPQSRLLVLCGPTHDSGEAQILKNLHVLTGAAGKDHPAIQQVVEIA
jgi:3',5'-cyclic-AMP phosphodiesterase